MAKRRASYRVKMAVGLTMICFGIFVLMRRQPYYNASFHKGGYRSYRPVWEDRIQSTLPLNITRSVLSNWADKNMTKKQVFVQYERHKLLTEACKKYPKLSEGKLSVDTQRHLLVNEKEKLLYCFVPKVACSNWKRVMMKLAGKTKKKLSQITPYEAHAKNGLRTLLSYKGKERINILATYTAFMFARNPFARILSAYKHKFGDVSVYRQENLIHDTAKLIIKKYRENPSKKSLQTGENVTWTEFVSFLTDPAKNYFNEHWREMYKLCAPCKVQYDFLGHLETLDDDVKFMFQELNLENKIKYPSSRTSHPTNSTNTYQHYYMQLTTEQIRSLWKTYEEDFELFGYPKPSFVSLT